MGLGLVGAALTGALGGAGEAVASNATEEIKNEAMKKRDEYLEKLRQQSHVANKNADIAATEGAAARERTRQADFYNRAGTLPSKTENAKTTFRQGDEIDAGNAEPPPPVVTKPTRREEEEFYLGKARAEGDGGLIDRHTKGLKEARDDEKEERRGKTEDERNRIAAIRAEADKMRAEASQEAAAAATTRAEALLNKINGKGGDGDGKDTARIKDIKFYAENVFGRGAKTEEEKAAALKEAALYVLNKEDKSSADRIMAIAKELKDDPKWATKSTEERMNEARRLAGTLDGDTDRKRGGVSPPAAPGAKPKVAPALGKPWEKFKPQGG